VRGHAARKQEDRLGYSKFGPWFARAPIVDDEAGTRGFAVRAFGAMGKRIEVAFDIEVASRKLHGGLQHVRASHARSGQHVS
jgi:hypothetical protein